ncbi:MAG: hypothetical protein L0Z71_17390 [Anaerolineae bacterium]|nr:hypothetical protein [Anaerolineae bacterium]
MAMRAATMGPMTPIDTSTSAREQDNLFRKLVLLLLLITAAVLWTVLLFKQETNFPLLLSTFFTDASLGLIAGFGSRILLRKRDWFVRFLVALFVAVIGMIMIGSLTDWVLGIGPIKLESKIEEQIREIRFDQNLLEQIQSLQIGSRPLLDVSKMDWADLVHLEVSILMMILSLHAWRSTISTITPQAVEVLEVTPLPTPSPRSTTGSRRGRRATSASNGRAHVQLPGSWLTSISPSPTPQPRTRSNNGSRSTVLREAKKVKDPMVKPKRRRSRRKPHIQFAIVEEHRCPYCLDAVTRTDPRGVEECEVCHTLHHADCWAITGVCQVPHLNN